MALSYDALVAGLAKTGDELISGLANLRDLISGVSMTSKSLAAASDEAAAKQSTTAVDQIANSVELVSSGAQNQASQIADTATAIEELSPTAEQIAQVATNQAESIALTTVALQKLDNGIGALVLARQACQVMRRVQCHEQSRCIARCDQLAAALHQLRSHRMLVLRRSTLAANTLRLLRI